MASQLGRYTLTKKIGSGGMADVWLATGPNGVCVLKCPHPHLCDNPEFVRMFLDEASLLAQLTHPGIAQIYDLGHVSDVYYLAMEYVPGFDLMSISLEQERHGELMAPELCARIVADAAAALHYAHDAKDVKTGAPLNLVHRDVTPHNILVSTQGVVKIIDFGVAKASSTMHRTQAGFVKGKYPYMAPEQITGQTIDRRVDVYALGLVLYELLTNVRAIPGNTEIEQIDAARTARIRPIEQLRPNTPIPLRQILAACLFPDVSGRYPTALALKEDLEKFLSLERQVLGQDDLLRLFRVVAADVGEVPPDGRPTETEQPASGGDGAVVIPDAKLGQSKIDELGYSPTAPSMKMPALGPPLAIPLVTPAATSGPEASGSSTTDLAHLPVSRGPLYALTALSLLIIGMVLALWKPWAAAVEKPGSDPVATEDAGSGIPGKVDAFVFPVEDAGVAEAPVEDAGAPAVAEAPVDAGAVVVGTPGGNVKVTGMATLKVNAAALATVKVDGEEVGQTPFSGEVSPGAHSIVVQGDGISKSVTWTFKRGEKRVLSVPLLAISQPAKEGTLQVKAEPFCSSVLVDGAPRGMGSFMELKLKAGAHNVQCVMDPQPPLITEERRKSQVVKVTADETTTIKFEMMP